MNSNIKKAFTLIELLVVISIIALLLSILMPALSKVKAQAQFVVCGSNLKQMVTAEIMYTVENNGVFSDGMDSINLPISYADTSKPLPLSSGSWQCRWHNEELSNTNRPDLAGQLWQYLENQKVVSCPTSARLAMTFGAEHDGHDPSIPMEPQYAFSQNAFLGNVAEYKDGPGSTTPDWGWAKQYQAVRMVNVNRPASVFMFSDENLWYTGIPEYSMLKGVNIDWSWSALNDNGFFTVWDGQTGVDCFGTFHKTTWLSGEKRMDGVANAVFADGHLQTVLNYAEGDDYMTYIDEPRNCIRLSDPRGWYRQLFSSGP